MKYAMCNIHNNYHYYKYFIYNDLSFILFHCDFTYNLLYDTTLMDVIFWLSDFTINASCL